jgi:hypothetical protein
MLPRTCCSAASCSADIKQRRRLAHFFLAQVQQFSNGRSDSGHLRPVENVPSATPAANFPCDAALQTTSITGGAGTRTEPPHWARVGRASLQLKQIATAWPDRAAVRYTRGCITRVRGISLKRFTSLHGRTKALPMSCNLSATARPSPSQHSRWGILKQCVNSTYGSH